jgi:predicted nucleotidyltransferase component of viral defense system
MKEALVEKTLNVIEAISQMEFVKSYFLVGGTALSLQLKHRLSEDLDFMCWKQSKKDKQTITIEKIKNELSQKFVIDKVDILGNNHIEISIDGGVKLSFYAPDKIKPQIKPVHYLNNLILADEDCIAALKMEMLLRRNEFRDYYDLYCILKNKDAETIKQIIGNALKYSEHHLKTKNLIGMLTNSERFKRNAAFAQLAPKDPIPAKEIELFMVERMRNTNFNNP